MMCYRGSDDDVVGFGHFAEARKVKTGPRDSIPIKSRKYARSTIYYILSILYTMLYTLHTEKYAQYTYALCTEY
jgi:hypothetical protein